MLKDFLPFLILYLEAERFASQTDNASNQARTDGSASGFKTRGQRAFFRRPKLRTRGSMSSRPNEAETRERKADEKSRAYAVRIQNTDHETFSLVISTRKMGQLFLKSCQG